jgi:hypothetical protein
MLRDVVAPCRQDGIPKTIQKRRQQEEAAWTVTYVALTTVLLSIGGYIVYTKVKGQSVREVTQSIAKAFRSASDTVSRLLGLERQPLSIAPGSVEPQV